MEDSSRSRKIWGFPDEEGCSKAMQELLTLFDGCCTQSSAFDTLIAPEGRVAVRLCEGHLFTIERMGNSLAVEEIGG